MNRKVKAVAGKLQDGIILLAVTSLAAGYMGLHFILDIERKLNEITDVSAPMVETADDLVMNVWEATKVAEEIYAAKDADEIKPLDIELRALMNHFDKSYSELTGIVKDESLRDELANVEQIQLDHRRIYDDFIDYSLLSLREESTSKTQLDQFDLTGSDLIAMLEEFAEENELEMQKVEDQGDALLQSGNATINKLKDLLGSLFEQEYPMVEASLKLQKNNA